MQHLRVVAHSRGAAFERYPSPVEDVSVVDHVQRQIEIVWAERTTRVSFGQQRPFKEAVSEPAHPSLVDAPGANEFFREVPSLDIQVR